MNSRVVSGGYASGYPIPVLVEADPSGLAANTPGAKLDADLKDTNPKDAAASSRLPVHMVPDTLNIFAAMAFAEGDSKYIAYNFRIAGVRVTVYVAALRRHLMRYFNGEWADKKTGVPHLASVAACTSILIDGHVLGTIVDDRPPAVDLSDCIEEAERIIARVYEMNKAKRPQGIEYTQLKTPRVPTLLGGLG